MEEYEKEIREQERQKVIAELEEWIDKNEFKEYYEGLHVIEYESLKQKLNEIKGE